MLTFKQDPMYKRTTPRKLRKMKRQELYFTIGSIDSSIDLEFQKLYKDYEECLKDVKFLYQLHYHNRCGEIPNDYYYIGWNKVERIRNDPVIFIPEKEGVCNRNGKKQKE